MKSINLHSIFHRITQTVTSGEATYHKKLLIYFDKGVSAYSAFGCLSKFRKILDKNIEVSFISSHNIKNSDWEDKTVALVIPGGRSKPYYDSLGKEGNGRITRFVNSGGGFLGICAGAYYASAKTEFEVNTSSEIILDGKLNFFQGKAQGPAFGPGKYSYYTLRGVEAAQISWTHQEPLPSGNQGFVYYNGGCSFSPDSDHRFKILARYTELPHSPIAAITGRVGQGNVVLTGVHFEITASLLHFYPGRSPSTETVNKMILGENYHNAVISSILIRLGFTKKDFSNGVIFSDTLEVEKNNFRH